MARGVYLIGSKLAQRVRAVQIVDCAGNSTTLRLKDYISQKIEPEYKTLPWQYPRMKSRSDATRRGGCGEHRQAARVIAPAVRREAEEDWGK